MASMAELYMTVVSTIAVIEAAILLWLLWSKPSQTKFDNKHQVQPTEWHQIDWSKPFEEQFPLGTPSWAHSGPPKNGEEAKMRWRLGDPLFQIPSRTEGTEVYHDHKGCNYLGKCEPRQLHWCPRCASNKERKVNQ